MTKEREAEIRALCRDGGTAQWWVVANELLKEIDRLRALLKEAKPWHACNGGGYWEQCPGCQWDRKLHAALEQQR